MDIKTISIAKAFAQKAIAEILGSDSESIESLKEFLDVLADRPDFVDSITTEIDNKVDKVDGKTLSSNDFTDELLEKLNELSLDADDGIESIQVNGTNLQSENGIVNIPLASMGVHGVVTSSDGDNKVSILEDGTMTLNNISFSKIVQDEEDSTVVFVGGDSTTV